MEVALTVHTFGDKSYMNPVFTVHYCSLSKTYRGNEIRAARTIALPCGCDTRRVWQRIGRGEVGQPSPNFSERRPTNHVRRATVDRHAATNDWYAIAQQFRHYAKY